jgi:hypothetical protein
MRWRNSREWARWARSPAMTMSSLVLTPALLLPAAPLSSSAVAVCAVPGPASAGMADPLDLLVLSGA